MPPSQMNPGSAQQTPQRLQQTSRRVNKGERAPCAMQRDATIIISSSGMNDLEGEAKWWVGRQQSADLLPEL